MVILCICRMYCLHSKDLAHGGFVDCTLPCELLADQILPQGGKYYIWKGIFVMCVCMYYDTYVHVYTYACIYSVHIYVHIHAAELFAIAENLRNKQLQCVSMFV